MDENELNDDQSFGQGASSPMASKVKHELVIQKFSTFGNHPITQNDTYDETSYPVKNAFEENKELLIDLKLQNL